MAPGDFFGETGLLADMGEAYTLEALTRVTVYEIDQQAFAPLLINRPAMAEDFALSLSRQIRKSRIRLRAGRVGISSLVPKAARRIRHVCAER